MKLQFQYFQVLFLCLFTLISQAQVLPIAGGKYFVGVKNYTFTDASRYDSSLQMPRIIPVKIWYPCTPAKNALPTYYITNEKLKAGLIALKYYRQDSLTLQKMADSQTHSYADLPLKPSKNKYPVVFFSSGWGISNVNYTTLIESLVSKGCIVVSFDHLYCAPAVLPNGKLISNRNYPYPKYTQYIAGAEADIKFVCNRILDANSEIGKTFGNSLDKALMGAAGHSIGGTMALDISKQLKEIKYAINLDGGDFDDFPKTALSVNSLTLRSAPSYTDEELIKKGRSREIWNKMGAHIDSAFMKALTNTNASALEIKLNKTGHMSFTDAPFLMPTLLTQFGGTYLKPEENLQKISSMVYDFILAQKKTKPTDHFMAKVGKEKEIEMCQFKAKI